MQKATKSDLAIKVVKEVNNIPKGKVITSGDISIIIRGNKNSSQAVGQAIHSEAGISNDFPWWCVIFTSMKPKEGAEKHLEDENVCIENGKVTKKYLLTFGQCPIQI